VILKRKEPYSGRRTDISAYVLDFAVFQGREEYYEKRLLTSSLLSVRMEQIGSNWTDFQDILYSYMNVFRKSVKKIKVSLKPDNNTGYFT